MKKIKTIIFLGLVSTMALMTTACSDDKEEQNRQSSRDESKGDHVWKQQTDTLKSAKEMAKKMQKRLDQQQQNMDESN